MPNVYSQNVGWICPRCGHILAPHVNACPFCAPDLLEDGEDFDDTDFGPEQPLPEPPGDEGEQSPGWTAADADAADGPVRIVITMDDEDQDRGMQTPESPEQAEMRQAIEELKQLLEKALFSPAPRIPGTFDGTHVDPSSWTTWTGDFPSHGAGCEGCPNHPKNGGTGICLCTLGATPVRC